MSAVGEIKATDFSFARVPAATLVAIGVRHVFRYLAYLPNGKVITKAERDDDVAHGIVIHYNWETTANRPLAGAAAGDMDGREAARQTASLGDPGAVVIASLDVDPHSLIAWQWENVRQYAIAFSHHCPFGFYSGYDGIERAATWGVVREFWQTAAWSGSQLSAHANYYQRTGHSWRIPGLADNQYDEDVVIHAGGTPSPVPPPAPTWKVHPMYNPPLAFNLGIAAVWTDQDPGTPASLRGKPGARPKVLAIVAPNGDVYAWGVPFRKWSSKGVDFVGRTAAKIGQAPHQPDGVYMITDTAEEIYVPADR